MNAKQASWVVVAMGIGVDLDVCPAGVCKQFVKIHKYRYHKTADVGRARGFVNGIIGVRVSDGKFSRRQQVVLGVE